MTGEDKRALVGQALTERANELAEAATRLAADPDKAVSTAAAGISVAVDHIRAFVEFRLPFQYQDPGPS